ncbi:MAG: hypothetical protein D6765_16165 [Bacteroidetes bacterium]|nr:MAG: hypothetical protein D6765_16165 [Bacteroidota bacterium]
MRKALQYGILFALLAIATLLLSEITLRLYPGPWNPPRFWVNGKHPGIIDPDVGPWNKPNFVGSYRRKEFFVRNIHWNQFGMRDKPRTLEKSPGIKRLAVLGDSFMEAVQVADDQTMASLLEEKLLPEWEVLNFGKGGIGTCEEYLVYQHKVRAFQPDVVVLVFWPGNDVLNNSIDLVEGPAGHRKKLIHPYFIKDSVSGEFRLKPASTNPDLPPVEKNFRYYLKKYTALYRFWRYFRDTWQPQFKEKLQRERLEGVAKATTAGEGAKDETPFALKWKGYGVYCPPIGDWIKAWETTKWCLGKLKEATEEDGASFLVVSIPPVIDTIGRTEALEKSIGETVPQGFSWNLPARRLKSMAQELGAHFLDLTPGFIQYAHEKACSPPCFFWKEDGHWNELGHEVAAQLVYDYLKSSGLLQDSIPLQTQEMSTAHTID